MKEKDKTQNHKGLQDVPVTIVCSTLREDHLVTIKTCLRCDEEKLKKINYLLQLEADKIKKWVLE